MANRCRWHQYALVVFVAAMLGVPFPAATSQQQPGSGPQGTPAPANAPGCGSPPPDPQCPDLVGQLMPPRRVGNHTVLALDGKIVNAGARSQPTIAQVVLQNATSSTVVENVTVPSLEPNTQFEFNRPWAAPPGTSRLVLVVDPEGQMAELNESNNEAATWVHRDYDRPVEVGNPFRFEDASGSPAPRPTVQSLWANGSLRLTLRPEGNQSVLALVNQVWLDSRLNVSALENVSYSIVSRDGTAYYAFSVPGGASSTYVFGAFAPSQERAVFGRGSLESVLFDERPMSARLVRVPRVVVEERQVTDANGTRNVTSQWEEKGIVIEFEDGNPRGQSLWFSAAWLESWGIQNATFEYEGGDKIPFERKGGYYRVDAPHFTWVFIYEYCTSDGFAGNPALHGGVGCSGDYSTYYKMDYTDDTAIHAFIPSSHLANTVTAWLDIWARASTCPGSGDSMTVFIGSTNPPVTPRFTFNPCNFWGTTTPAWGRFGLDISWLTSTTYVQVRKTSGTWTDRNILLYYTTPHSFGQSTMAENFASKTGELVWSLSLETNAPPATPALSSPGWGATVATRTTLTWNANGGDQDGDLVYYNVWYGTTNPPTNYWGQTTGTSYAFWGDHQSTYYWKVCANDYRPSHVDQCSNVQYFTMVNQAPGAPGAYLSPSWGATGVSISAALSWNPSPADPDGDTVYYRIYFGTTNPPSYANVDTTSTSYNIRDLGAQGLTTYWWQIASTDYRYAHTPVYGASAWYFTTANMVPPNMPSNPSPGSGAANVPWDVPVSWSGGDPEGQYVNYYVYARVLGTTQYTFRCSASGYGITNTCTISSLSPSTTFEWYVAAYDQDNVLTENRLIPWNFTTKANLPPAAPTTPFPAANATNVGWTITPTWYGAAPEAGETYVTYRTYRRTLPSGTFQYVCLVYGYSAGTFVCTPAWSLARGTSYEWKVEATDRFGATTVGGPWTFTTKPNTPPPACMSLTANFLTVTASVPQLSSCLDQDGDAVTYTLKWWDGSPTENMGPPSNSYPPPRLHEYKGNSYCPSGTATVTLTARDAYDNGKFAETTNTETRSVSDIGHDQDGDGLWYCAEQIQQTRDSWNDPMFGCGWELRDCDGDSLGNGNDTMWSDGQGDGLWEAGHYVGSTWVPGRLVFSDYAESQWSTFRNIFCPIGAVSSCAPNPRHKDVYVEMDYLTAHADGVNHLPLSTTLQRIADFYRASPHTNPDGYGGITLHIDAGPERPAFNLGGGNDVGSHPTQFATDCGQDHWENFDDMKRSVSPRSASGSANLAGPRWPLFHYALWLHDVCPGSAGLARGVPHHEFTLAAHWPEGEDDRFGVFIHEFGHALGLSHGGAAGQPNSKPNYFSSMNYRWAFSAAGTRFRGYSTVALQTLDESSLYEPWGFFSTGVVSSKEYYHFNSFIIYYDCPGGDTERRFKTPPHPDGMDFNCNGGVQDFVTVVANMNGRTRFTGVNPDPEGRDVGTNRDTGAVTPDDCTEASTAGCDTYMTGHDDWAGLRFNGISKTNGYGLWGADMVVERFRGGLLGGTCLHWTDGGSLCRQ